MKNVLEIESNKNKKYTLITLLLLLSTILYTYQFNGILITQYILVILFFYYIFFVNKYKKDIMFIFIINLFFILSLTVLQFELWFDNLSFIKSLVNFNVIIISYLIVLNLKLDIKLIGNISKKLFYIIIGLEIIQFVFYQFGVVIPYATSEIWISDDIFGTLILGDTFRPRSIFGEPSWLCISLFCLFFIMIISDNFKTRDVILFIIAQLMTKALTGLIAILFIFLIIFKYKNFNNKKYYKLLKNFLIMFILIILFLPFFINKIDLSNLDILNRLQKVIEGNDLSFFIRFEGSLKVVQEMLSNSLIFGAGLGNENNFANYFGIKDLNDNNKGISINNLFNYLLITFGLLGTFVFILINTIYIRLKLSLNNNISILWYFIFFNAITSALFITPLFWINLGLIMKILVTKHNVKDV